MAFAIRDAIHDDFDQCIALTTDRFLYEARDLAALRRMWQHIVLTKCGLFGVITDTRSPSHVLHFGVAVFVNDVKADAYRDLAFPGIARAMVHDFQGGGRPFLSRTAIAQGNAAAGLNLVFTHHGYEERFDQTDERLRAATYEWNLKYLSGWNVRTYTNEVFAANTLRDAEQMAEVNGVCVKRYARERLRAAGISEERAPRVWLARRDDPSNSAATNLTLFNFSPPVCNFSLEQQDMLLLALDGHTDESIARTLGASLSTIKKRFHSIYQHAQTAAPDSPGLETRRGLLNFLREHAEELRPYALQHPR